MIQSLCCKILLTFTVMPFLHAKGQNWTVSLQGAGPIRIGMTLAEVRRVLNDNSASLEGNESDVPLSPCTYLNSKKLPRGLGVMFFYGRIVRVDIDKPGVRTIQGASVGDTESRIKELYQGQLLIEPHYYDPAGHYLNYVVSGNRDRDRGIVFETDGSKVTSFRTGTQAAIALVEGCN
jgi:hypothetical protein